MLGIDAAAASRSVAGDLIDRASSLADRATSYPPAARVVFFVTLALVLISLFVYAALFRSREGEDGGGAER
jgi:hypothetical protein